MGKLATKLAVQIDQHTILKLQNQANESEYFAKFQSFGGKLN